MAKQIPPYSVTAMMLLVLGQEKKPCTATYVYNRLKALFGDSVSTQPSITLALNRHLRPCRLVRTVKRVGSHKLLELTAKGAAAARAQRRGWAKLLGGRA